MDFSRRAYSAPCKFFRDSDAVSQVRWMEAAPGALTLPFTSAIVALQQEPQDGCELALGEQFEPHRKTTLARAPAGSGREHVCGTAEDFDIGGVTNLEEPLVVYDASGLPACCNPARVPRGGAGVSGGSLLTVETPIGPGGNFTCATATPMAFGQLSGGVNDLLGPKWWIQSGLTPGQEYLFTSASGFSFPGRVLVSLGTCADLTAVYENQVGGNPFTFTAPASGNAYVTYSPGVFAGTTYEFGFFNP